MYRCLSLKSTSRILRLSFLSFSFFSEESKRFPGVLLIDDYHVCFDREDNLSVE